MNAKEQERLNYLREGPFVSTEYLSAFYGVSWPFAGELQQEFEVWWNNHKHLDPPCPPGMANRYELERFLRDRRATTFRLLALQLGMQAASLELVLCKLGRLGLRRAQYDLGGQVILQDFRKDLVAALGGREFPTFFDVNGFCRRMHQEIEARLGVQVAPAYCATSQWLGEEPAWFGQDVDCLTLEPVSVRHQVWLDFGKPLSLSPDACSKRLYAENHDALKEFLAGASEPDDLQEYCPHVAAG